MAWLGNRVPTMPSMCSVDSDGTADQAMTFAKAMDRFMQRLEKEPEAWWNRGDSKGN